jgi:hypothetical protein
MGRTWSIRSIGPVGSNRNPQFPYPSDKWHPVTPRPGIPPVRLECAADVDPEAICWLKQADEQA